MRAHAAKKAKAPKGPKPRSKMIDGFKVMITDHKVPSHVRFSAFYDQFPEFFGHGSTEEEALAEMKRAADRYHKNRDREMWDEHEADKERRLRDGTY